LPEAKGNNSMRLSDYLSYLIPGLATVLMALQLEQLESEFQ
jgi:hypothetical protein